MSDGTELDRRIRSLKRTTFLRRVAEIAANDSRRWVAVGLVGEELGLPYEEALAITDSLREEGLIRRGGGGRLEPPLGPRVRLLPAGLRHLEQAGED